MAAPTSALETREVVLSSATAVDVLRAVAAECGAAAPVLVRDADLVLPPEALQDFRDTPRKTFAVVAPSGRGPGVQRMFSRLRAVATDQIPVATPDSVSVGVVRIDAADTAAAAEILHAAADELAARPGDPVSGAVGVAWVIAALVRSGVWLKAQSIDPWPWHPDAEPLEPLDAREVERIQLIRANRALDGFVSVHYLRRLSKITTAIAARRGWAPNAITVVSLLIGLAAAGFFAQGSRLSLVIGAVLLQVSLIVDCSDGEVARLTGRFSPIGAWLDAVTDRVKEYAAYAGLAIGAAAGNWIWWAAAALLTLQTTRHLTDYVYFRVQWDRLREEIVGPLLPAPGANGATASPVVTVAAQPRTATFWIRKIAYFPIGERWLVISVVAALLGAPWVFVIMLALGLLSFAYANLGRLRRTLRWRGQPAAPRLIALQVDTGIPGRLLAPLAEVIPLALPMIVATLFWLIALGAAWSSAASVTVAAIAVVAVALVFVRPEIGTYRFGYLVPAGLALIELSLWIAGGLLIAPGSATWVYCLLFAIAFHRYDILYRALADEELPVGIQSLCGGAPLRVAICAVLLALGSGAVAAVVPIETWWLVAIGGVLASIQWARQRLRGPA